MGEARAVGEPAELKPRRALLTTGRGLPWLKLVIIRVYPRQSAAKNSFHIGPARTKNMTSLTTGALAALLGLQVAMPHGLGRVADRSEIRGIWAECEGCNATLSSRAKIEEMVNRLGKGGFNTVFVQIYRGNKAWYRSALADSTPCQQFYAQEKTSPMRVAIDMAHKKGIKVHAWVNMFRVWGSSDAKIIRELGRAAVTRDSRGRSLLGYHKESLPDGGYWLDPGDPAARKYLVSVIEEILKQYPEIDGIHLDYTRYPYDEKGKVDFGYGVASTARFKKIYGVDPLKCTASQRALWDQWRRDQVTEFVREAASVVHRGGKQLSAATVADEKKYRSLTFQDWPRWIREGLVDSVVPMNYSSIRGVMRRNAETILNAVPAAKKKVIMGLGAYKLIDSPDAILSQIKDCRNLGAGGVTLFSYDNMAKHPGIFSFLGKKAFGGR